MSFFGLGGEIGWWCPSLDDSGVNTTTLNDLSGNGRNGTLSNMVTSGAGNDWIADTTSGGVRALDFNGNNNFVNISGFATGISTGDFSISVWVYPRALSGYRMWFSSSLFYWYFSSDNTSLAFDTSSNTTFRKGSAVNLNAWQNFIAVRSNGSLRLYKNGSDQGVSTADAFNLGTSSFSIGRWAVNNTLFFNGLLDDLRLINRAITQQEITKLASKRGYQEKASLNIFAAAHRAVLGV